MHDMLVRLYDLPEMQSGLDATSRQGVAVRRALVPEKAIVTAWVQATFPASAPEVDIAFGRSPVACFLALRDQRIVGFACHDVTARNFFGPEAVIAAERGRGIGRALLLCALHAQREQGYAYAIIGGVGPAAFYEKCVGAVPIAGSDPGIYAGMLRQAPQTN
jgi:GNAT superfamily N-acetyltransferase